MAFFIRNLKQEERLGERIKTLRRQQNLTLKEIAEATKIQQKYLEAFENGRYELLPEPIYAKNFLKRYILTLRGDPNYFLSLFSEEIKRCDLIEPHRLPLKKTRAWAFFAPHRLWKILIGTLFFLIIVAYLGWQISSLLSPPKITVLEPLDGTEVSQATIIIKGLVDREAEIFVNGFKIIPDLNKNFTTSITLERGLNIITVEAKTKHSKMATVYRKVVLNQENKNESQNLSTSP